MTDFQRARIQAAAKAMSDRHMISGWPLTWLELAEAGLVAADEVSLEMNRKAVQQMIREQSILGEESARRFRDTTE